MLVSQSLVNFAEVLASMHARCFEKGWSYAEFQSLLNLPTTRLWINEQGFLLCSEVAGEMEILTIGVLPEFRRKGYALKLLFEMKDYARQMSVQSIFLEVAENNLSAQGLYAKMGFKRQSIRYGYYQTKNGPVNGLCLRLDIQKG